MTRFRCNQCHREDNSDTHGRLECQHCTTTNVTTLTTTQLSGLTSAQVARATAAASPPAPDPTHIWAQELERRIRALESAMPLTFYDVARDEKRPPTQADIDNLTRIASASGALKTGIHKLLAALDAAISSDEDAQTFRRAVQSLPDMRRK